MENQITQSNTGYSDDLPVITTSASALVLDSASMDSILRLAEIMAKGRSTVPAHLQGNVADCAAVIMQAIQWRMNPYAVAQKTHLVNGVLGYEAQLVNAVIQSSGVTEDRINYEWYGPWERIIGKTKVIDMPAKDNKKAYQFRVPDYSMKDEESLGVRAWATIKGEANPRTLELLLVQAAVRNSPLWASDPKQQLAYLAVKRWARLHTPDVILGVYTPDELAEVSAPPASRNMGSAEVIHAELPAKLLEEANKAAKAGMPAYQTFWTEAGVENRKLLAQHHEGMKAIAAQVDSNRTVDNAPATGASSVSAGKVPQSDAPSPELEGLAADLDAAADEGIEQYERAWASLSPETHAALKSHYPRFLTVTEGVAQ